MIEALFELVGEVIMQIIVEGIIELGISGGRSSAGPSKLGDAAETTVRDETSLLVIVICFAILGALCGAVSVEVIPHRLLPPPKIPGLSLLLSPLGTGLAMHAFGRWRSRRGLGHSRLATFAGGALFAFAFAATRYVLVRAGSL